MYNLIKKYIFIVKMSSSANVLSNIFNLTKKNILITGGSSGLGEHFAYLMASAGAPNIVLAATVCIIFIYIYIYRYR